MTNGTLAEVVSVGPGPLCGTDPHEGVLSTIGRVGVVYRDSYMLGEPGRVEVLFPDRQRYTYALRELARLTETIPLGWEWAQ